MEEDFTLCSWTLKLEAFPGMHTGDAIVDGLVYMMERRELNAEYGKLLVRDGASNAVLQTLFL